MLRTFRAVALAVLLAVAPAAYAGVGFQHIEIHNPDGPAIEAGVWYPSDAPPKPTRVEAFERPLAEGAPVAGRKLPLVVMSHGLGGSYAGHYDTAEALARAGFVAAALTHTGDNWRKGPLIAGPNALRPRELKLLVDYMLEAWPDRDRLDPTRVGAFGFSLGGFTVLAAAGGQPDMSKIGAYNRAHPDRFDSRVQVRDAGVSAPATWTHDARIKAVIAAAPALSYTYGDGGLAAVVQPVQLWTAERDRIVPFADNVEIARAALPRPPEFHSVPNADHYDFLPPCSALLRQHVPEICESPPGFDRAAFHETFNREVVAFFRRTLAP
jgi:predicted dienelactone hydrolase